MSVGILAMSPSCEDPKPGIKAATRFGVGFRVFKCLGFGGMQKGFGGIFRAALQPQLRRAGQPCLSRSKPAGWRMFSGHRRPVLDPIARRAGSSMHPRQNALDPSSSLHEPYETLGPHVDPITACHYKPWRPRGPPLPSAGRLLLATAQQVHRVVHPWVVGA